MDSVAVSELAHDYIQAKISGDPLVVLAGSGISIWKDTNLPTGKQFAQATFNALFRHPRLPRLDPVDETWVESWFVGEGGERDFPLPPMPFEVLLERCPRHDSICCLIAQAYNVWSPNPIHNFLAEMMANGRVHAIVTTNYENGLESSLKNRNVNAQRVVRKEDLCGNSPIYFKIHGTAGPGYEDTLVYKLRSEGLMDPWKRELLRNLILDKILLIVGYSGVDFDVCPEISLSPPRLVLWNFFSEDEIFRSPGLLRIEEAGIKCIRFIGDMRILFKHLGMTDSPEFGSLAFDVSDRLQDAFTPSDIMLWRARIFNSIGHARLALATIRAMEEVDSQSFSATRELGQAYFHSGAFAKSGTTFLEASRKASDDRNRRLSILDASDAFRCYGDKKRASTLIEVALDNLSRSVGPDDTRDIMAVADIKKILLYRDSERLVPQWIRRIRLRKNPELKVLFQNSITRTLEGGDLFGYQQVGFWAERMGLSVEELTPKELYRPALSREGYRHLAYPVALAMEACDRANEGNGETLELTHFLKKLMLFECYSQAWKLSYALIRTLPSSAQRYIKTLVNCLQKCEYTWTEKVRWFLRRS